MELNACFNARNGGVNATIMRTYDVNDMCVCIYIYEWNEIYILSISCASTYIYIALEKTDFCEVITLPDVLN